MFLCFLDSSDLYLGFCKQALYSAQKIGSISTWEFVQGDMTRFLHAGVAPQNLERIDDKPKLTYKGNKIFVYSCFTFYYN